MEEIETEIILTPELVHYAKKVEKGTGRFICWVKDPKKELNYKDECKITIEKAIKKCPHLSFVKSCNEWYKTKGFLTSKQLEKLKSILEVKNDF